MSKKIVIHYHEIALKKGNRRFFVNKLTENIKTTLKDVGGVSIENLPGRLLLSNYGCSTSIVDKLGKIPGIANFMQVEELCDNGCHLKNLDRVKEKLEKEIKKIDWGNGKTFRVTVRRADKNFPQTSEEVSREVGAFVVEKTGAKVKLKNPDITIYIDVLKDQILLGFERIQGIKGLPVGSSGKVVSLLSGGIDSPVSSFMMMKRGCRVVFVHFHSHPFLDTSSQEKAQELVKILDQYQNGSKLYLIPFGEIQKQIVLSVPEQFRVVVYRRLMMRIAGEIAEKEGAGALVTGESLGQVASQTLENMSTVRSSTSNMILRPLVGMDKEEIIQIAKEIDTYDTSIQADQDCCQLFMPKHPATKSNEKEIEKAEKDLDVEKFVSDAIDKAEIH